MRRLFLLSATVFCVYGTMLAAGPADVKAVYLMPMGNGLDQHLAVSLSQGGIVQVVTDPAKADTILTDHLGKEFEESLNELYTAKKKIVDENSEDATNIQTFVRVQSGGRVRGNLFMVDRKTGQVVWSTYVPPKDTTAKGIKRASEQMAEEFAKAVKAK